ncbi:MAG: hypothetical protein ACKVTZ_09310 [Bacteroidia bacterium]
MKKFFLNFMVAAVTVVGLATSACTVDACKDIDCVNGTCDGTSGEAECVCNTGYEQDATADKKCTVESRTKFLNSAGYDVVETGTSTDPFYSGTFNYVVTVASSASGADKIIITKFGALGCAGVDLTVVGTISDKTKISFGSSSCGDITITGSGTYDEVTKKITATWTGTGPAGGTGPTSSSFSSTGIFTKK